MTNRYPSEDELALWRAVMLSATRLHVPSRPQRLERLNDPQGWLDLHGTTIDDAYHQTIQFLESNRWRRCVVVITGHGQIRDEILQWLTPLSFIKNCQEMKHGGAFHIYFR